MRPELAAAASAVERARQHLATGEQRIAESKNALAVIEAVRAGQLRSLGVRSDSASDRAQAIAGNGEPASAVREPDGHAHGSARPEDRGGEPTP